MRRALSVRSGVPMEATYSQARQSLKALLDRAEPPLPGHGR